MNRYYIYSTIKRLFPDCEIIENEYRADAIRFADGSEVSFTLLELMLHISGNSLKKDIKVIRRIMGLKIKEIELDSSNG